MKKYLSILVVVAMLFGFAACSNNAETTTPKTTENTTEAQQTENTSKNNPVSSGKTLVVYFSVPETDKPDNMTQEEDNSVVVIDGKVLGNTQYVANVIKENTGADLFRIEPKIPYTTNHKELVDLAKEEQNSNARPEIKDSIENFEQYETVFVGYPNWWYDLPQIMYSFFDEYDFSGKTIVPFCVHNGSQFTGTIDTIKELEPNANVVTDGFAVSERNVSGASEDVAEWLNELNY